MIQLDLSKKNILLTGASDGIGKSAANFLMKMGGHVAVHYNSNKNSAETFVNTYNETTKSKVLKADLA